MALAVWRCSDCGATGVGNSAKGFAEEETDHMLTGCNGQLRFEREWSLEIGERPKITARPSSIPRSQIIRYVFD